ncbi:hypothetical protein TUMSATVNIG1_60660 (plasmid) [Vibrio nigripulchritudo]|uniref:hypothetical protein n=1 Tax=Vibrio nigripulchritudo TaxID=28173 RepID=UPI00190C546B|nr:hypothetical protein [Vibrio nigripulchritudo]BCL74082.1 hypothetical protein VNTUMSATTG_60190 [Vibrio nigripulchritudo]BDU35457.1 hypothetical protein TUMSATVNIG1_60660 [Vibrio nigripulchritudo]
MSDNNIDVQRLFQATVQSEEEKVPKPTPDPVNKQGIAHYLAQTTPNYDFGSDSPIYGQDMVTLFNTWGVPTTEICAALKINQNRWSSLSKMGADGRDMRFESISPTLEIFLRLLSAFPEYAPWKKATPQEVADVTGFSLPALAEISGSNEDAGKRWEQGNNETNAQVSVLLNLIYKMAKNGVPQIAFREAAQITKDGRSGQDFSKKLGIKDWVSEDETVFRKVRKIMRSCINGLKIDGKDRLADNETTTMMKKLTDQSPEKDEEALSTLQGKATIPEHEAMETTHLLRYCLHWIRLRNKRQKIVVQYLSINDLPDTTERNKRLKQKAEAENITMKAILDVNQMLEDVHRKILSRVGKDL